MAFPLFHARSRAAFERIHPRKWTIVATEVAKLGMRDRWRKLLPVPGFWRGNDRLLRRSGAERILEIARARTSDDERGSSPFGREQAATPPYIFPLMPRAGFNGRNTGGGGKGAREARRREASRRLHRCAQCVNVRAWTMMPREDFLFLLGYRGSRIDFFSFFLENINVFLLGILLFLGRIWIFGDIALSLFLFPVIFIWRDGNNWKLEFWEIYSLIMKEMWCLFF